MKPDTQSGAFVPSAGSNNSLLAKFVILALLWAVAGLATMAKNGQYFPKTSPAHYVSLSTKLNVAHSPVHVAGEDLQPVARLFSLQAPLRANRAENPAAPPLILRICLTDSKQFRAPPAPLA